MADRNHNSPSGASSPENTPSERPDSPGDEQQKAITALVARKIEELAALPEDERRNAITAVVSHTRIFSGPLPPAEELAKYKGVRSDLPDRFTRIVENEQEQRHVLQKMLVNNDRHKVNAALAVALAIVAVAGTATVLGNGWIAVPLGLAGLAVTIVRQFLDKGSGPKRRQPGGQDPDKRN